jgi:hypothetical protein
LFFLFPKEFGAGNQSTSSFRALCVVCTLKSFVCFLLLVVVAWCCSLLAGGLVGWLAGWLADGWAGEIGEGE